MKKIYITISILTCLVWQIQAQTFSYAPKGDISETVVRISNLFADIEVEGNLGKEITISTDTYEGIPEKAKGLKPLSASGTENTGIGLSVVQDGNVITISGASRKANGKYMIQLPKNIRLSIDLNNWQAGDALIKNMSGEVEAKTQNGELRFESVTGPIVAHSLSSDIEVIFTDVNQASPTSLTSTSGDIDITIPANTKGNFQMSSISGEVFTDLNFQFENDEDMKRIAGGMNASATLNSGGVEILLKSVSGDIFIRKSK